MTLSSPDERINIRVIPFALTPYIASPIRATNYESCGYAFGGRIAIASISSR